MVLVTDIRGGTRFDGLFQALDDLKRMKCAYRILFMEASDAVIIKRYKESRRSHPLEDQCDSLEGAIALERKALAPLRERADYLIDTSNLSTAKLKGELRRLFGREGSAEGRMEVQVSSFGFKHGLPMEADLVLDVRFLPNPFYVSELRPLTGLDRGCGTMCSGEARPTSFCPCCGSCWPGCCPGMRRRARPPWSLPWAAPAATTGRWRWPTPWPSGSGDQGWPVSESHRDLGRT